MITILSTGDIPLETLESVFAEGSTAGLIEVDESQYFFKSVEPPSWVQLIASIEAWQALLGAGLSVYVSSLLAEAGKETWKDRKDIYKAIGSGSQMLLELAK